MKKIFALFNIELTKLRHQRFPFFSLLFTLLFAIAAAVLRNSLSSSDSLTIGKATGWQIFTFAVSWGFQPATLMLLIVSINLVAEEFSERTIKNILTRPVLRTQFLLAKILTMIFLVVIFVGALYVVGFFSGAGFGSFGNLEERGYILVKGHTIFLNLLLAFFCSLVTLSVVGVFGIFMSILMPRPGIAIGVCVGSYFALNVAAQFDRVSKFIFTYYTSYPINTVKEISFGLAASWTPKIFWCLGTDLGWMALLFFLANWILKRKDILT